MGADLTEINALFGQPLRAVNVGVDLFAEALEAQGQAVQRVDWRPPAVDLPGAVALFNDPAIDAANERAVQQLVGAQPLLVDVRPAGEVLPGLGPRTLFHAGPPIDWASASGPL